MDRRDDQMVDCRTVCEGRTDCEAVEKVDMPPGRAGAQLARDREAVAATVPAPLLAEYDRRAANSAGAALLTRGTCEGCRMMLPGTDLNEIRRAPEDEVVSCPECGCILVRTEESGLSS